jgi:hypothetical protein
VNFSCLCRAPEHVAAAVLAVYFRKLLPTPPLEDRCRSVPEEGRRRRVDGIPFQECCDGLRDEEFVA